MEETFIKDGKLYINYTYYSVANLDAMGFRDGQDVIEVADIHHMEIVEGLRGGDHGWTIFSKEPVDAPTSRDGRDRKYEELCSFGRKHRVLRNQVADLLRELKIPVETIVEEGSGPIF